LSKLNDDLNYIELKDSSEQAGYFKSLFHVFKLLYGVYQAQHFENTYECEVVVEFLRRLAQSMEALRFKYAYPVEGERQIWLDLSESGFPNQIEIEELKADKDNLFQKSLNVPSASILMRTLLDNMMTKYEAPRNMLNLLAKRTYLDMLKDSELFYTYQDLNFKCEKKDRLICTYPFACYDFATNRPFFHLLTFEADNPNDNSVLLENSKFKNFMASEGSRAAPLAVLAATIDEAFQNIHPKIIKRIGIGSLYTRYMLNLRAPNKVDSVEMTIREIFSKTPENEGDFILFMTEEIVFSKIQEINKSTFLSKGQIREIYALNPLDVDAYDKKASAVHYSILLPHHILQELSLEDKENLGNFNKSKIFVYNEGDIVYGI